MTLKTTVTLTALVVILAGGTGYWLGHEHTAAAPATDENSPNHAARKVLYWYDPMVPASRFDKPGKSPFMDMDLVPRYADETEQEGGIKISARQQQNLGVRTAVAARQGMALQFNAYGTIAADERNMAILPALASGVVEKLYISASQQFVKKGEPLAQLWIPQWAAAQQEYLAVRTLGDTALTAAARERLALQFMPEEIIQAAERSGKPQTRIGVRAPYDGYISKLNVRVGAQVSAAQPLLELATLDPVWLVIDYPASQASLLTIGSQVQASSSSWPGRRFLGRIDELLPELDATTRTLKARVVLENAQHQLKPGMYLHIQLAQPTATEPVLTIPEAALITTGSHSRVLVSDGEGYFRPVEVTAGRVAQGLVEIKSGLKEGEQVVTSGQFLIDSEASLRSALPQMDAHSAAEKNYVTQGVIKAVNGDSVTIAHQPVPALKWAAMTMDFSITAQQKPQLRPGETIMFHFSLGDEGAKLLSVMPVNDLKEQP